MDVLTKEQRRKNMQAIKSADTKIEVMLRHVLWKKGYRYRKNYAKLPGKPDIVFPRHKIAIFCDGEFWHGYKWDERKNNIKTHKTFWINKIEGNIKRDTNINMILRKQGWKVIRLWESEIKKNLDYCVYKIINEINN